MTKSQNQVKKLHNLIYGEPKLTKIRLVVSGNVVEIYNYERPVVYYLPFAKRELGSGYKENRRREDNLMVAQRYLRRLIFANVNVWANQTAFVTFTFADNVSDLKQANIMWRVFMRKLQDHTGRVLKYTAVVEFQKRGAVHYHVLFYNLPDKYVREARTKRVLAKLWGHGYVDVKTIQKMRSIRSVGAYVSKYLTKGALDQRLLGQKVYFSSRGLQKPMEYLSKKYQEKVIHSLQIDNNFKKEYIQSYASKKYGVIKYAQYVMSEKRSDTIINKKE